jgi:hypothetical protein
MPLMKQTRDKRKKKMISWIVPLFSCAELAALANRYVLIYI